MARSTAAAANSAGGVKNGVAHENGEGKKRRARQRQKISNQKTALSAIICRGSVAKIVNKHRVVSAWRAEMARYMTSSESISMEKRKLSERRRNVSVMFRKSVGGNRVVIRSAKMQRRGEQNGGGGVQSQQAKWRNGDGISEEQEKTTRLRRRHRRPANEATSWRNRSAAKKRNDKYRRKKS